MISLEEMGKKSKLASKELAIEGNKKNIALKEISKSFLDNIQEIINMNKIDIQNAKKSNLKESLIDRLKLDKNRIIAIAKGIDEIVAFPDPIGKVIDGYTSSNGLDIKKVRVPLGVIGIIYEARPNVTADAAALCLKSGNAVILRGGKEAINSNICISNIMRKALEKVGLSKDCIQLVKDTSRQSSIEMMQMKEYLDVLIPRGGAGLIKAVVENSKVPVIETGVGNCHVFVDYTADIKMAVDIVNNAKTSRPSVCNAAETLLVHKNIAKEFLPEIKKIFDKNSVEIRGCKITEEILGDCVKRATEEDYMKEFLDYIISVKVVNDIDEAIRHISKYSSGHSETIVTSNYENAQKFTKSIDSSAVYVNASTRFTDGNMFGLGAEIGISTQKLHARGPMGLNELTSTKFIINGSGQIRI